MFNKWKFFFQKIINNIIPTTDNLIKRSISVPSLCKFCNSTLETSAHLFSCQKSWNSDLFGLTTELSAWVQNFISYLFNQNEPQKDPKYQSLLFFVSTLWALWLHHNATLFKNIPQPLYNSTGTGRLFQQKHYLGFSPPPQLMY